MVGMTGKFAVAALAFGLSAGTWAQAPPHGAMDAAAARDTKKAPKPSAAPTAAGTAVQAPPTQPVVPLRPDQMPPSAPQVTYQDGQLSIEAQNSTLSSILAAVRAHTGAQVEMPADTVNDRVAVKLGPGNPRDVLASLLQGSRFDYIVLGSALDPNAVSQVILTPHQGGGAMAAAAVPDQPGGVMTGGPRPSPGMFRGGEGRPEISAAEEDEPAAEVQPPSSQPETPAPGAVMATPSPAQGAPGAEPAQPAISGQQNPNQPKTPEQLLQELQRMQQQQQGQQPRRPPQQPQQ